MEYEVDIMMHDGRRYIPTFDATGEEPVIYTVSLAVDTDKKLVAVRVTSITESSVDNCPSIVVVRREVLNRVVGPSMRPVAVLVVTKSSLDACGPAKNVVPEIAIVYLLAIVGTAMVARVARVAQPRITMNVNLTDSAALICSAAVLSMAQGIHEACVNDAFHAR
ncbi:hypothetical protein K440DRAFT_637542 [Wilcoxina mikolae CBS 423.85]|nr:hypothetical protein K440DRAFT_637542 [Wilcoxina mikolae CBS 423.85]